MKFKKFSVFSALTLASLLSVSSVFADNVNVMYNSSPITFNFAQPTIVESRTLVPLRGVFDTMGYEISYDASTKTATISDDTTVINASSEQMTVTKDGKVTVMDSDVKPQLINDYFMVPLRAVAAATGADVTWDGDTRTVYIAKFETVTEIKKEEPKANADEGKMSVEEKQYLTQVQETTTAVKTFAFDNNDELLKNALGVSSLESIEAGGDAAYYKKVTDALNKLKNLEPPEAMTAVQALVENYVNEINSLIETATGDTLTNEELSAKSLEASSALAKLSEDFGVELWNYFSDNNVLFENVYGEQILDALK